MSENTQVQLDSEKVSQLADSSQEQAEQKWSREQLQARIDKANAEAKEGRKAVQELKKQMEETTRAKLAEEGQFKELVNVLQREVEEAKAYNNKMKEAFAFKIINDSVASEAKALGCVDPEVASNLINLSDLPIDEQFNVDRSHVRSVLEDVKRKKPYLFENKAPKVLDAIPAKPSAPKEKSIDAMTTKDIENVLLTKFGKK